jgi:hypothetical protein
VEAGVKIHTDPRIGLYSIPDGVQSGVRMDDTIRQLRATLPPLLKIPQYCHVMNRCMASAYSDLRTDPGLAVKVGGSTRILRDRMLDKMARLPKWVPQRDRVGTAAAKSPKHKSRRPRARHRDPGVRP